MAKKASYNFSSLPEKAIDRVMRASKETGQGLTSSGLLLLLAVSDCFSWKWLSTPYLRNQNLMDRTGLSRRSLQRGRQQLIKSQVVTAWQEDDNPRSDRWAYAFTKKVLGFDPKKFDVAKRPKGRLEARKSSLREGYQDWDSQTGVNFVDGRGESVLGIRTLQDLVSRMFQVFVAELAGLGYDEIKKPESVWPLVAKATGLNDLARIEELVNGFGGVWALHEAWRGSIRSVQKGLDDQRDLTNDVRRWGLEGLEGLRYDTARAVEERLNG